MYASDIVMGNRLRHFIEKSDCYQFTAMRYSVSLNVIVCSAFCRWQGYFLVHGATSECLLISRHAFWTKVETRYD